MGFPVISKGFLDSSYDIVEEISTFRRRFQVT